MKTSKEIFLDKSLYNGWYYELAIQTCSSTDNKPINSYTDFIWSLENIEGPYDNEFNLISPDIQNTQHIGIIHLDNYVIPFILFNVREEPIETGFNWFDICFNSNAIEKIFGSEFQTELENPKVPVQLDNFFMETIKNLYKIYPFQLAIKGLEVSGQYYLDDLKIDLKSGWSPKFYLGKENYKNISEGNKKYITKIEDIEY